MSGCGSPSYENRAEAADCLHQKEPEMKEKFEIIGVILALTLGATLGLACAQGSQLLAAFEREPAQLEARGPGAVFGTIDAAAVDALTYAYLQARAGHSTELMRGGTIYRVGNGYSYDEIHVAGRVAPFRIHYPFGPQDVARFHLYPRSGKHDLDLANEQLSHKDGDTVSKDSQLRPLYVLHPLLMIREYRGEKTLRIEVADLRHPELGSLKVARGQEAFREHCAKCHGEGGDGRGKLSPLLSRQPTNFCDPSWVFGTTSERTYRIVREGAGTQMPAWKAELSEPETRDLVAFVTNLGSSSLARKPDNFRETARDLLAFGQP
jgi:mono/diheme cytochrome c family protein